MRRLLIINPNTSTGVSALLQGYAQQRLGEAVQVKTVTARFGAPYIACEASYAVAGHAVLDAWAAELQSLHAVPPDAVLIGCFGDPGLMALRESSAAPVVGLAEAAFAQAAQHGRFAVVTGGHRWQPMLERLALTLGYAPGKALAGVHTVALTGAQLLEDMQGGSRLLLEACRAVQGAGNVQAIVLGGAGLAGMAERLQPEVDVPLIDSVQAGCQRALELAASASAPPQSMDAFAVSWRDISPEMTRMGLPAAP